MPRYQRHVFICINKRPPEDPKGCCSAKGSEEVRGLLKKGLKERGLNGIVRANAAGCLDACGFGTTVVIYPEGVWYGGVKPEDVEEIIEKHIIGGELIERLVMKPYQGGSDRFPPLDLTSLRQPQTM
jgi:(2Fe-2S) ferredoxin